ncbi:flagellar hook-basal body complex protein FliE [Trinickia mobilis]|uniref:flagellar hook-basal body complex protein FliE n=1 Tax=Trinickia mobilis TaxID=2816356 RepID=UPI001F5D61CF|nr:flagellar hook-basal body complex protein FliE [Trinickia mobilis]
MQPIQMDVEQIRKAAVSLPDAVMPRPVAEQADAAGGPTFSDALKSAVRSVDDAQQAAETKMTEVDSGASDDLVGAMLANQQASVSFSMLTQVRNKVVSALDDLLKMPL